MASPKTIHTELARMALLYRHALAPKEISAMTMAWTELCHNLNDQDFISACKLHLAESRYFPSPADILDAARRKKNKKPDCPAIPEATSSQEESYKQAVHGLMLLLSLQQPDAKKFFSLPSWDEKKAFAQKMLGKEFPAVAPKKSRYHGSGRTRTAREVLQ